MKYMTDSKSEIGLLPEGSDEFRPALHRFEASVCVAFDLSNGLYAQVGQLALLGIAEQILDRVELWGISRQPFKHDVSVQGLDVVANDAAAMRGQPVPDDQQLAPDGGLERLEVLHDLRTLDRTVEESEVEAPQAHPGDQRELLPVEAVLQHWGLAFGRPGAHSGRTLAQSRLVDEDDGSSLPSGVFFSACQRFFFHSTIACSSRWMARPTGRCALKPRSRSNCHTYEMLNEWPNSRSINLATRAKVHISVAK